MYLFHNLSIFYAHRDRHSTEAEQKLSHSRTFNYSPKNVYTVQRAMHSVATQLKNVKTNGSSNEKSIHVDIDKQDIISPILIIEKMFYYTKMFFPELSSVLNLQSVAA